jgi:hypothetical protein
MYWGEAMQPIWGLRRGKQRHHPNVPDTSLWMSAIYFTLQNPELVMMTINNAGFCGKCVGEKQCHPFGDEEGAPQCAKYEPLD